MPHIHTHAYTQTHTHAHTHMRARTHTHTHTHTTHTRTHTHTHTHAHTHTQPMNTSHYSPTKLHFQVPCVFNYASGVKLLAGLFCLSLQCIDFTSDCCDIDVQCVTHSNTIVWKLGMLSCLDHCQGRSSWLWCSPSTPRPMSADL